MKNWTIELDNDLGRGRLKLENGKIICQLPDGTSEDTSIYSSAADYDEDVMYAYGSTVWDLQAD